MVCKSSGSCSIWKTCPIQRLQSLSLTTNRNSAWISADTTPVFCRTWVWVFPRKASARTRGHCHGIQKLKADRVRKREGLAVTEMAPLAPTTGSGLAQEVPDLFDVNLASECHREKMGVLFARALKQRHQVCWFFFQVQFSSEKTLSPQLCFFSKMWTCQPQNVPQKIWSTDSLFGPSPPQHLALPAG